MLKIPLTQGKFALVDDCDYEHVMQWKWYYHNGYAVRNRPGRGNGLIRMHRVILERMGFIDFEECDHVNRDGVDNRQRNLRTATRRQNGCNRGKQRNNTSGYIGVHWHGRKWQVRISINGKQKHLGYFDDKKEAARVYNLAARMHRGEFAVLNEV